MSKGLLNLQQDLVINNEQYKFNLLEDLVLKLMNNDIMLENSNIICYPDKQILYPIILKVIHNDYDERFKYRIDSKKRVSVLLISCNNKLIDFFENVMVRTKYINESCKIKQKHFYVNNIWNPDNDYYNTQSYWISYLKKRYRKNYPELIKYKETFPVSIGYKTFNTLTRNYLGKYDSLQQSVLYITSNPKIFNHTDLVFNYVIIDYSSVKHYISNIPHNIPSIYFFDNLLDTKLLYLKNKVKNIIAVDGNCLKEFQMKADIENKDCYTELLNKIKIEKLKIKHILTTFDDALERLFIIFNEIKKNSDIKYENKIISKLIMLIVLMPISAVKYDQIALSEIYTDTISDLLIELEQFNNPYFYNHISEIRYLFEDIFNKYELDSVCPKYENIREHIKKSILRSKRILIITFGKIFNIALKHSICIDLNLNLTELEENGVIIITQNTVSKSTKKIIVDEILITGCYTLSHLKILHKVYYNQAFLFLYDIEINILRNKLKELEQSFNSSKTHMFKCALNEYNIEYNYVYYKYLLNRIRSTKCKKNNVLDIDFERIVKLSRKRIHSFTQKKVLDNYFECKLIRFIDNTYIFVKYDQKINVISYETNDILRTPIDKIGIGDKIVLFKGNMRGDIFNEIINSLNKNDKIRTYNQLINRWHEILEDVVICKELNYNDIFVLMKEIGWDRRSPETIKYWLDNISIGPRKKEDIVLLGKALKINEFIDLSELYYEAMREVRGVRISVGKQLNKIILKTNTKDRINLKENIAYFEKLGIDYEELENAIELKEVNFIDNTVSKVKPSDVGICIEGDF